MEQQMEELRIALQRLRDKWLPQPIE